MIKVLFGASVFFSNIAVSITNSTEIYIHSENIRDITALTNNEANSISSATNGAVLNLSEGNNTFQISLEYMTTKRSIALMDAGKNICVVNKIKNSERIEKYIFSLPVNVFLGRRLYQSLASEPLSGSLQQPDGVYLPDIFKERPNEHILITDQVSYGDRLDAQISLLPSQNIMKRSGGEHITGIVKMFNSQRAEYALLYPQTLFSHQEKISARSYELSSIKPYVVGHLMCTNSAATKSYLKHVNQRIKELLDTDELLDQHLRFLNPNDAELFHRYFQQVY